MAWAIEYGKDAEKEIAKLDRQMAQRIIKFMGNRVAKLENPRSIGEALTGSTLAITGNTGSGITASSPKFKMKN